MQEEIKNEQEEVQAEQEQVVEEQTEETVAEEQQEEAPVEKTVEDELAEQKDKFIRLYSEFENFRRRTNKEKLDLISTASEGLVKDLLPVLDDFERALKAAGESEETKSIVEGIELIQTKFLKTLTDKGLKPINATGETFDADLHEAITQIPAPSEDMKGKVVDEVEKGYYLGEKVIRYSKVVIGQ